MLLSGTGHSGTSERSSGRDGPTPRKEQMGGMYRSAYWICGLTLYLGASDRTGDRDGRVARKGKQKATRVGGAVVQRAGDKFPCPSCESSYTDAFRLQVRFRPFLTG